MKSGRSLTALAAELERETATRKDFLAPSDRLTAVVADLHVPGVPDSAGASGAHGSLALAGLNGDLFTLRPHAAGQIAQDLDIPKRYFGRLAASNPKLLADNVNHWLKATPHGRLVRVLDGQVRGWLSPRYRPLDNYDLAETALPIFQAKGATIISAELTELRLYIKATLPSLRAEFQDSRKVGQVVEAGVVVRNSEVGAGALGIEPFALVLSCLNGAVFSASLKKFHVGRAEGSEEIRELLTTDASQPAHRAVCLHTRDVLAPAFDEAVFRKNVGKLEAATTRAIETTRIEQVVEVVTERFNIATDTLRGAILKRFVEGGDLTQFGISQAITREAQEVESYDLASDLERIGGKVIELPTGQWKALAAGRAPA